MMHGEILFGKLLQTIVWIVQDLPILIWCSSEMRAKIQFIQINTKNREKNVAFAIRCVKWFRVTLLRHLFTGRILHVSINYRTKATLPNDLIGGIGFSISHTTNGIQQWIIIKSGEARFHSISQLHFSLLHIHSLFLSMFLAHFLCETHNELWCDGANVSTVQSPMTITAWSWDIL